MQCFLICNSELVRIFEDLKQLPQTGSYYQCVENFREIYLPKQRSINIPHRIIQALKYGQSDEVVMELFREYHATFSISSNFIADMCLVALKNNRMEIFEFIFEICKQRSVSFSLFAHIAGSAIQLDRLDILERVLKECKVEIQIYPSDVWHFVSYKTSPEMLDRVMATCPNTDVQEFFDTIGYLPKLVEHLLSKYPTLNMAYVNGIYHLSIADLYALRAPDKLSSALSGLEKHLDKPDTVSIITKYGYALKPKTIYEILGECVRTFNYEIFDLVLPLFYQIKDLSDGRKLGPLYAEILVIESRYFFDAILAHPAMFLTIIDNLVEQIVRRKSNLYFFKACVQHIKPSHLELCVIHDTPHILEYILSTPDHPHLKQYAALAHLYSKERIFLMLVKALRPSYQQMETIAYLRITSKKFIWHWADLELAFSYPKPPSWEIFKFIYDFDSDLAICTAHHYYILHRGNYQPILDVLGRTQDVEFIGRCVCILIFEMKLELDVLGTLLGHETITKEVLQSVVDFHRTSGKRQSRWKDFITILDLPQLSTKKPDNLDLEI